MRIYTGTKRHQAGSTLLTTLVFSGIMGVTVLGMVELSAYRARMEQARWNSNQAFYHTENVLNWAVQKVADATEGGSLAAFLGNYSFSSGALDLGYLSALMQDPASGFQDAWVTIANHPRGLTNLYLVTASTKVGDRTRSIQATLRKSPAGKVFDYSYFLNNWGWWWGSSITGYGDNRANWDFDFRYTPTVNGAVSANGNIESNGVKVDPLSGTPPFAGLAGADPVAYVRSGAPRVQMPNLRDFSYYAQKATNAGGKLYVGSTLVATAVHNNTTKPGLYLAGTTANPVRISGPVVVNGDVIISGPITGIGTLYVGGNLYIAGDMTYLNGPSFASPPNMMTQANRDAWVRTAIESNKDMFSFAVRESILGGAVNSTDWKTACYDAASYGLKNVGAEGNLGADGIAGTPDDGIAFRDTNGDGVPDSAWNDVDGDGVVDAAYNYSTQIQVTAARAALIDRYPTNTSGYLSYDSLSTNSMNRLDGIFYCNHAMAMRLSKANAVVNGSYICQNEAIVFSTSLKFTHDARAHSRYSADPFCFVDFALPVAQKVRIESVTEIAPQTEPQT